MLWGVGGFVHHMLKADNRLMGGRPFTDEEVISPMSARLWLVISSRTISFEDVSFTGIHMLFCGGLRAPRPGTVTSHSAPWRPDTWQPRVPTAQIASQINTFMLAGYETTASALAFTVYHLANTPAAESKLIQEVDAFGGRDAVPSYDDLNSKVHLDASKL